MAGQRGSQGILPLSVGAATGALLIGDCNREAIAAVLEKPWRGALYLEGPAGSGKSLIAAIWASWCGAPIVPAAGLDLGFATDAAEGAAAVDGLEALGAVEEPLFHVFNAISRAGGRLLLTGRAPPRGLRISLKDLATRLHSVPVARIAPPDEVFLESFLARLAEERQLVLPAPIAAFLVPRMPRTHEAAINLVEALDRLSLEAGRPVSRELASEALKRVEI